MECSIPREKCLWTVLRPSQPHAVLLATVTWFFQLLICFVQSPLSCLASFTQNNVPEFRLCCVAESASLALLTALLTGDPWWEQGHPCPVNGHQLRSKVSAPCVCLHGDVALLELWNVPSSQVSTWDTLLTSRPKQSPYILTGAQRVPLLPYKYCGHVCAVKQIPKLCGRPA